MVEERFYKHLGPFNLIELMDGLEVHIPEGQFVDIQIQNAAPVDQASRADITYLEGKNSLGKSADCRALACLVHADKAHLVGGNNVLALVSKHPRADFAAVLGRLYAPLDYGVQDMSGFANVKIAQGVVIGAGAEIGEGSSIGPNSVIGPGVRIGKKCQIGANVVIEFSRLGDGCKIHHGAVLGGTGFGVALTSQGGVDIPHVGSVVLGDNVSIGCNTTIDRALFGETKIGTGSKLDNLIQIAHNVHIGKHCMLAGFVGIAGSAKIGDGVLMGGGVGIKDHLTVGDGATLTAKAAPIRDVPAGEVWGGTPATPIREQLKQLSALRRLAKNKTAAK